MDERGPLLELNRGDGGGGGRRRWAMAEWGAGAEERDSDGWPTGWAAGAKPRMRRGTQL